MNETPRTAIFTDTQYAEEGIPALHVFFLEGEVEISAQLNQGVNCLKIDRGPTHLTFHFRTIFDLQTFARVITRSIEDAVFNHLALKEG